MTDEEKNVNSLKEAYRLWNETKAGTVDHWLGLMTDDVHFRSLAEGAHSMEFTCTSSLQTRCRALLRRAYNTVANDLLPHRRVHRSRRSRGRAWQLLVQTQNNR